MSALAEQIATLLPNGLGARGDEERNPLTYPARSLHILLATSGSVASIKAPLIVRELLKVRIRALKPRREGSPGLVIQYEQVDVQVVATKSSLHFFDYKALEEEHNGRVKVWTDAEEWEVSNTGRRRLRLDADCFPSALSRDGQKLETPSCTSRLASTFAVVGSLSAHPSLVLQLRRWADIVLVAPCSANTLAKITHGICDNILVSGSDFTASNISV